MNFQLTASMVCVVYRNLERGKGTVCSKRYLKIEGGREV